MSKKKDFDKYEMKLASLKDKFHEMVDCGANQNMENIDAEELGQVVDVLKDIYESCYYLNAAKYYESITDAMEEANDEEKEMYMNKYLPETREWYGGRRPIYARGRGRMRDSRGRYMYMPIDMEYGYDPMRELEWKDGRMYYFDENEHWPRTQRDWYSGNNGNGMSTNSGMNVTSGNGNYYGGESMRDPREGRSGMRRKMYMEKKENGGSKEEKHKELEHYMSELGEDIGTMLNGMESSDKTMIKQKLAEIASRIS